MTAEPSPAAPPPVEREPEPTIPPPPSAAPAVVDIDEAGAARRRGIPEGSDSDLWVFTLDSFLRAQEAMLAVSRLVQRGHLDVEDAAIVTLRRGRVRLVQTRDINPAQGALSGAWLGTLAGLLAGVPLVGAALGAAAGGMYGRLRDFGIDDAAMKEFGAQLDEGRSALFLLVRDCHRMRALYEVSRFPARLERSSADPDVIVQVRQRLAVDPWDG